MENTLKTGGVFVLSESDFDTRGIPVNNTKKPIVLALLSENCGWCHKTAPELIKAARNRDLVVCAVIVGNDSPLGSSILKASRSSGVPTFLLFKNKKFTNKGSGFKREAEIISFAKGS